MRSLLTLIHASVTIKVAIEEIKTEKKYQQQQKQRNSNKMEQKCEREKKNNI